MDEEKINSLKDGKSYGRMIEKDKKDVKINQIEEFTVKVSYLDTGLSLENLVFEYVKEKLFTNLPSNMIKNDRIYKYINKKSGIAIKA